MRDYYTAANFFAMAVPDMDRLAECLKLANTVLIFKIHPLMNDFNYQNIKKLYADCPQFLFWDNANDIYEIFDKIDLAIVDYSSIFYDLIARGVKKFIRYTFNYDNKENLRDFALDYKEHTCGTICGSFDELLNAISNYEDSDLTDEIERIKSCFGNSRIPALWRISSKPL